MGLGSAEIVTLAHARAKRDEARRTVSQGKNPISEKKLKRDKVLFGTFSEQVISDLESGWKNEKHVAQWKSTIKTHAACVYNVPVDEVDVSHVLKILTPIWNEKPETATRLRGRIERILDAARAKGLRNGDNPARWRGHLQHLLPRRAVRERKHHPAARVSEMPKLYGALNSRDAPSAKALMFTILTACRTNEALASRWEEIDIENKLWTIPASRMKAGKTHRVPLSQASMDCLGPGRNPEDHIFATTDGRPLSNMAMAMLLRRMGLLDITVHGFRSTFRDWAGDQTDHSRETIEAALAHVFGDATERAYRRGDALEKRRILMDDWASFLTNPPSDAKEA
jgi:integrase